MAEVFFFFGCKIEKWFVEIVVNLAEIVILHYLLVAELIILPPILLFGLEMRISALTASFKVKFHAGISLIVQQDRILHDDYVKFFKNIRFDSKCSINSGYETLIFCADIMLYKVV